MATAIHCRDLRKTYNGKVEAVRGLSLDIETGECFGLLGPNGAGKTTTIEILEGLLPPTSGEVTILGHSWERNPREVREWLGISLQETRLSEKLSVRETLILFLDGPTAGLDPRSRRQLWDIILSFQSAGGTVWLTTPYMDEAERLCDRLAIIDHGQVIAEGTPADLIERLGGHHVVEFAVSGNSDGAALDGWRALPGVDSVRHDDGLVCLNARERSEERRGGK